jgi:cyclophilin family peptidyl-prolyl cis-trans isomerase
MSVRGVLKDTQLEFSCKEQKEDAMKQSRRYFMRLAAALSLTGVICNASAADVNQVLLKTNMGDIVLELYPDKAPKTVANFLQYVKSGHYKGTVFHRVIDNFMIQGGGFDQNMKEKPTKAPIENEAKNGLKNETYSVAMARTPDPHSASAQFFINVKDNAFLDYPGRDGWGYAVFGKVVKGTDVVDKIKKVETGNNGVHQNVPLKPVVIESASVIK